MSKLFAGEELDIELPTERTIEARIENSDIPDIVETHEAGIQVAVEGILKATNDLYIVNDIRASLESKKLSSVEYFTSIENYNLFIKSIANNLGVKTKIPSMEDFKNPYGAKASHQFVMEGFVEFMRSIWEKIKSFFKDFFKRIMLFLKRLVNANLEMEEYEEYVESLMQKVKKSDKKTVDSIEIDSKLPAMLTDFGMDFMDTSYLLSKGEHKLENLSNLVNILTDTKLVAFEKQVKEISDTIVDKLKQGSKYSLEEVRLLTSMLRSSYNTNFTSNIFTEDISFKSLPDEVQGDVLNNFSTSELEDNNIKFLSITRDRDHSQTLPNNFNMYIAISEYDTASDDTNVRTSKLMIFAHKQKNLHINNRMKIINDRNDLLRFYDFYKKFNKNFKIERINDRIVKFEKTINNMIDNLKNPFKFALEAEPILGVGYITDHVENNPEDTQAFLRNLSSQSTTSDTKDGEYKPREESTVSPVVDSEVDGGLPPIPPIDFQSSVGAGKENNNPNSKQIHREFEYFQRYVFNYMNCSKTLLKEFSVNVAATTQECRYEMIKLLYKSAKQF